MHQPQNSTILQPPWTNNAPTHQISMQSNNPRWSHCNLITSNFGTVHPPCIWPQVNFNYFVAFMHNPLCTSLPNFSTIGQTVTCTRRSPTITFLLCCKVTSSEATEAHIHETWRHSANSCRRHCSSLSVTVNSSVGDVVDNDEMNEADRCHTCCGNFDVTVCNEISVNMSNWRLNVPRDSLIIKHHWCEDSLYCHTSLPH